MKRMFLMALMSMVVLAAGAQTSKALSDQLGRSLSGLFDKEAQALQPDTVSADGEWQKVIETPLKAQEAYKYARQVLARMVPNYQRRVQLEDEKECKIICDVALELLGSQRVGSGTELMKGLYQMTMTFMFKDGRYRIRAEGVTCTYLLTYMGETMGSERGEAFRSTNLKTRDKQRGDLQIKAGQFIKSFKKALEKQKADNDF